MGSKAGMTSGFIVQDFVGYAVAEVVWAAADADKDGRVCRNELEIVQKKDIPARVKQLYIKADECLNQEKFVAAVTQNGGASEFTAALTKYVKTPSITNVYAEDAAMAAPMQSWSADKKAWCCDNVGLACPATTTLRPAPDVATPETTPQGALRPTANNDVVVPAPVVVSDGDTASTTKNVPTTEAEKKISTVGLPLETTLETTKATTSTTVLPFGCAEGAIESWHQDKRDWCCDKTGFGCTTATQTTTPAYDCKSAWVNGWAEEKRTYCCETANVGCTTTTTLPYDCKVDYSNWHIEWADGKKKWCCYHFGRGCPTMAEKEEPETTTEPLEPETTTTEAVTTTTEAETTTTLAFDCDRGSVDAWTSDKAKWCCKHADKGCTDETPEWVEASVNKAEDQ